MHGDLARRSASERAMSAHGRRSTTLMHAFLAGSFALAGCGSCVKQDLPQVGTYRVGVMATVREDHSRQEQAVWLPGDRDGAGRVARPLVWLVWYPAVASAREEPSRAHEMEVLSGSPSEAAFAKWFEAYSAGVFEQNSPQPAVETRDSDGTGVAIRRPSELGTVSAVPNAPPALPCDGFPIIVYHCGAASSFVENVPMFEDLASSGYIVVTSDFHASGREEFSIDGAEASTEDVDVLLSWVASLPYADATRTAMIGHSLGAQVALRHAATSSNPMAAYILLETTQDPARVTTTWMWSFLEPVLARKESVRSPLLFVAEPHAGFELGDLLVNADRWYLTLRGMGHDDYTRVGLARTVLGGGEPARQARDGHEAVMVAIESFLNVHLRGGHAHDEFVAWMSASPGLDSPCLEHAPPGTGSPRYPINADRAPTPREARSLLDDGLDAFLSIISEHRSQWSGSAIYDGKYLYWQILGLLDQDRAADARRLWLGYRALAPDSDRLPRQFESLADVLEAHGAVDQGVRLRRYAAILLGVSDVPASGN